MNKKLTTGLFVWLLTILSGNCLADDSTGNLVIQVRGLPDERGQVIANLFRAGDDVLKIETFYLRAQGKISDRRARVVFQNLKYGEYAVSVFHDENGNGILDHNLLRLPAEPLGFSNGFQLGLFSGLPNFEKLHFFFSPGADTIEITVK